MERQNIWFSEATKLFSSQNPKLGRGATELNTVMSQPESKVLHLYGSVFKQHLQVISK